MFAIFVVLLALMDGLLTGHHTIVHSVNAGQEHHQQGQKYPPVFLLPARSLMTTHPIGDVLAFFLP